MSWVKKENRGAARTMRVLRQCRSLALLLGVSVASAVSAQTAPSAAGGGEAEAAAQRPRTVAVIAAIGDRVTFVRHRRQTGSNLPPYSRSEKRVNPLALNRLVLDGIDDGFAQTEPQTRRVLLDWLPPPAAMNHVDEKRYVEREERLEALLIEHLRQLPERAQWDEIVAVLPKWHMPSVKGMGERLAGIGFYVQPLARERHSNMEDDAGTPGVPFDEDVEGDYQTIDPTTGEKGSSSVFVAVFMYFQTVTLDARTLAVKKREARRDSVRYHDPKSTSVDVGRMFDSGFLAQALSGVVQRSAERAITGDVSVGPARALHAPSKAEGGSQP